jgi:hypothetical protein
MNCTTCRYQLSQCLDGRLPSGKRGLVMKHAESCSKCSSFWQELQAAQALTTTLRNDSVSSDFKDELWTRIHAGEGTPNAVFQEHVPLLSKLRYALTGAAAAAALLIGFTMLRQGDTSISSSVSTPNNATTVSNAALGNGAQVTGTQITGTQVAGTQVAGTQGVALEPRLPVRQQLVSSPFFSVAKPLSVELLAVESARQLESRYATATIGMRMLENPRHNQEFAINQILDSADELRDFGELLLDLRDRQRLFFTDSEIGADLQFAVKMLAQTKNLQSRTTQTVELFVAPVLRSKRLARVSQAISLKPIGQQEDMRDLVQLSAQRPEVFPKLFFVLGNLNDFERNFATIRPGMAIILPNGCEPSWVAPRSEVSLSRLRHSFGDQSHLQIQIEVHTEQR